MHGEQKNQRLTYGTLPPEIPLKAYVVPAASINPSLPSSFLGIATYCLFPPSIALLFQALAECTPAPSTYQTVGHIHLIRQSMQSDIVAEVHLGLAPLQ